MQFAKQKLVWFWENAEKIIIVLFFLTFSFNIRKVFLTPYSFLREGFNEYLTISLSWVDVLMVSIILIYTIKSLMTQYKAQSPEKVIINNKNTKKSRDDFPYVSHETFFFLFFLAWCGASVFWSVYKPIAIYRFVFLIEVVIFAIITAKVLKNDKKWLKMAIFAVIIAGLFQSVLGILQLALNKSLGLRIIGESIIDPNIDGVAKIIINGKKHIRAYGTFPHPNIMAGFLIIPLFLLVKEIAGRFKKVSHETLLNFIPGNFLLLFISITTSGFVLTLSRSAFLGFFLGLIIFISFNFSMIRMLNFKLIIPAILLIFLFIVALVKYTSFFSGQSLRERDLYQNVSRETISSYPLTGVGIGQFILFEFNKYPNLKSWQYQPVHNLYLLVASELGSVGILVFLLFIVTVIRIYYAEINPYYGRVKQEKNYSKLTKLYFCVIISFLLISFFDHYFWDIKIGAIIFTLPFILFHIESQSSLTSNNFSLFLANVLRNNSFAGLIWQQQTELAEDENSTNIKYLL